MTPTVEALPPAAGYVPSPYLGLAADGNVGESVDVDRWTPVAATNWTGVSTAGVHLVDIDLARTVFTDCYMASRIFGIRYLNCGFDILVVAAGGSFLSGRLCISTSHGEGYDGAATNASKKGVAGMEHSMLDLSVASQVVHTTGFKGPAFAVDTTDMLTTRQYLMARLRVTVFNVLRNNSGDLSGKVVVTVFARPRGLQLWGKDSSGDCMAAAMAARAVSRTVPQGILGATTEALAKSAEGVVTGVVEQAVAPVANTVNGIAGAVGGVVDTVKNVFDGVGSFFGNLFGLARPVSVAAPTRIIPSTAYSIGKGTGLDNSDVIGVHPFNPPTVTPELGGLPTDSFTVSHMAAVPSVLTVGTWSAEAAAGDAIVSIPINPRAVMDVLADNSFEPTYCHLASSMYRYWNGTMRYSIQFTGTTMCAGRIRVEVIMANGTAGNENTARVVDIQGSTSINLDVPFAFSALWAQESIGKVVVSVVNPLVLSELAVAVMDVDVWVSCPDLVVAMPIYAPMCLLSQMTTGTAPLLDPEVEGVPQMMSVPGGRQAAAGNAADDPAVAIGPVLARAVAVGYGFQGASSLRDMCHRPGQLYPVTPFPANDAVTLFPYTVSTRFLGYFLSGTWTLIDELGGAIPTPLSHFMLAYQWWAGPMRFKARFRPDATMGDGIILASESDISILSNDAVYPAWSVTTGFNAQGATFREPFVAIDTKDTCLMEGEQPFNTPQPCVPTGDPDFRSRFAIPPPVSFRGTSGNPTLETILVAGGDNITGHGLRIPLPVLWFSSDATSRALTSADPVGRSAAVVLPN